MPRQISIGTRAESAFLWFIACLCCLCTRYTPCPDFEHLYQVLSTFLMRGQLLLEPSLPPLSLWASKVVPSAYLSAAGVGVAGRVMLFTATATLVVRGQTVNHSLRTTTFLSMSVAICYCALELQGRWTILQACLSLSECVVASVVLLAMDFYKGDGSTVQLPTWARFSGLIEGSLVLAWALGANMVDTVTGLFLVYTIQLRDIISIDGRSFKSEVLVLAGCFLATVRILLLPVLLYLVILGVVFSGSETASGGNYNLHFLSAQARRAVSPSGEESRVPRLGNHSVPKHSIVPYVPVSLYLPGAGFLWQDEAIWLPQSGVFGDKSELVAEDTVGSVSGTNLKPDTEPESTSLLYRVYFSDPIGSRHPWAFEHEQAQGNLEEHLKDYVYGHLWSGEIVSLRSRVTGHYLGTAGGQRSLIDQELNVESSRYDEFRRMRVSGHDTKSEDTAWIVQYDPSQDGGFRLFNSKQHCFLASSFRLYPDWDAERGNDTVAMQLNMIVEATYTRASIKQYLRVPIGFSYLLTYGFGAIILNTYKSAI
ncbi:hypothetical protein CONLIGDRAFT_26603 [Coniochaeta ligniaria NRRL 30616]|uniref:Uncharacterized protein n=1 Tax=Coniochaeta ligniaria NRRL 30616 TaxID=1408157 RepID=A0A1J7J621_9PEZI|nr:hypothetical protein CONLIGDRAFT_26603 [Coniochaeta ligniaria NRRL 30616]